MALNETWLHYRNGVSGSAQHGMALLKGHVCARMFPSLSYAVINCHPMHCTKEYLENREWWL